MTDTWLLRLRFLVGTGVLTWELAFDHHDKLWAIVIAIWLLGAPIEELVAFLTHGKIQIEHHTTDPRRGEEKA